jgi:hypothetical protein
MSAAPSAQDNPENKSLSESEQFWLGHYRRWQESGLSLASYARSQGLVVNSFYGWHRRLKLLGLAKPEPVTALFHCVRTTSSEMPSPPPQGQIHPSAPSPLFHRAACVQEPLPGPTEVVALRFRLPNGIDGELAGLNLGTCAAILESLLKLRP